MYLCSLHVVDAVVRTHFYKYFHPKEALIANGVLNRWGTIYSAKYTQTCIPIVEHTTPGGVDQSKIKHIKVKVALP